MNLNYLANHTLFEKKEQFTTVSGYKIFSDMYFIQLNKNIQFRQFGHKVMVQFSTRLIVKLC